jgi:hypothetical protein
MGIPRIIYPSIAGHVHSEIGTWKSLSIQKPGNPNIKGFMSFMGYEWIRCPTKYHIRKKLFHIFTAKFKTAEKICDNLTLNENKYRRW